MTLPFTLPFLNGQSRKRDQIIAIDLGGRTTKAVHLQRRSDGFTLLRYALLDAPAQQKGFSLEMVTEHLNSVVAALNAKTKLVALAVGVNDSLVRQAELPQMPVPDMRLILRISSKTYLQQDLSNHVFDCHIIPPRQTPKADEKAKMNPVSQKLKVLVAGAKRQLVADLQTAAHNANLSPIYILPGVIGPINSFELALPNVFQKDVVALVDIGFKNTTICVLHEGELILTRVVAIGGDKITNGLAESMNISYAEAESIKTGMPNEVQSVLEGMVLPLGRELRASLDFFEHQQEKHVSQVYISGGSARSEFITKFLETELMVPCRSWSPVGSIQLSLPPQQTAEIEQIAPQLTVALGTAAAAF
jgi:type IV pilus assembly protein PilM